MKYYHPQGFVWDSLSELLRQSRLCDISLAHKRQGGKNSTEARKSISRAGNERLAKPPAASYSIGNRGGAQCAPVETEMLLPAHKASWEGFHFRISQQEIFKSILKPISN